MKKKFGNVTMIPLANISKVSRRGLDENHVKKLMVQLTALGQINPIIVFKLALSRKYMPIDGNHRVEAHRRVGKPEIAAIIFRGSKLEVRLAQLATDGNLKYSTIEKSELLKEIYEEWLSKHADKRPKATTKVGRRKGDVAIAAEALPIDGSKTRRIKILQRAFKIADLPDEVKEFATQHGLDRNQSALLAAAREHTMVEQLASLKGQAKIPKAMKKNLASTTDKTKRVGKYDEEQEKKLPDSFEILELACTKAFKTAWTKASSKVKRRFLKNVLGWPEAKLKSGWN